MYTAYKRTFFSFVTGLFVLLLTSCYTMPEPIELKPDPNSAFEYYSRALNHYLDEEYGVALSNVDTAIKFNPFIAQFYNLKGDILGDMFRFDEALESYEKGIAIRAYNPELYEKMGIVASRLGDYNQAIDFHKKALAQDATQISLNLRIAENYFWMNHLQLAFNFAESYRKKAELGKHELNPDYNRIMGNIKFVSHEYSEAKKFYELYFSRSEQVPVREAKSLLHTYMELHEREKAYQFLLDRASLVLESGDTHFFRGLYYFKGDNLKDARQQLELALQSGTNEIDTYLYLGRIYYSQGDNSKALTMFRQYRELGGSSVIEEVAL